ncbi:hypothetical protein [Pseudomonas quasicaspiana]|uniref:hypothetical protein n=1 Tax=Pseudomonas quasicaspiana TaxID=2829821 RepID=UPI001E4B56DF|nr:hypothetical protein [Pseudomonas quasicaspiana]MCD5970899.1 hypothetical protein [Pseudomonas quasicaspiana]
MTDPEYGRAHNEDNNEEDSPGVDMAIFSGHFRVIAHTHCLLSVLLVAARIKQ